VAAMWHTKRDVQRANALFASRRSLAGRAFQRLRSNVYCPANSEARSTAILFWGASAMPSAIWYCS
jgi:hypothetical protein